MSGDGGHGPFPVARVEIEPTGNGAIVNDPATGRVHYLNLSAAFALALCDGEHTMERIAAAMQDAFGLPEPPTDAVAEILRQFDREGLVEGMSQDRDAGSSRPP